jgi:hypothetical protein
MAAFLLLDQPMMVEDRKADQDLAIAWKVSFPPPFMNRVSCPESFLR